MKGLGVELCRETLDLICIHDMRRAGKALADMQVVKEQAIGHSLPILLDCWHKVIHWVRQPLSPGVCRCWFFGDIIAVAVYALCRQEYPPERASFDEVSNCLSSRFEWKCLGDDRLDPTRLEKLGQRLPCFRQNR